MARPETDPEEEGQLGGDVKAAKRAEQASNLNIVILQGDITT